MLSESWRPILPEHRLWGLFGVLISDMAFAFEIPANYDRRNWKAEAERVKPFSQRLSDLGRTDVGRGRSPGTDGSRPPRGGSFSLRQIWCYHSSPYVFTSRQLSELELAWSVMYCKVLTGFTLILFFEQDTAKSIEHYQVGDFILE
ncbi:unnamed protein product [Heligmosomoides polygyrus]|uniref:Uncharacterized protein n=1 Tax=Heligmosomoides polygyrus TaxID=6339 RepID=A0A183GK05_HELPZ|nr:unnamed protein product [Heligmosomoides polygyrus]